MMMMMIAKPMTTMFRSSSAVARLRSKLLRPRQSMTTPIHRPFSASLNDGIHKVEVSHTTSNKAKSVGANEDNSTKDEKVVLSACGDIDSDGDDEDEQEEMFVEAHESFEHKMVEWGGPRRGGRLPEPTRFGDWERKGRCSDF